MAPENVGTFSGILAAGYAFGQLLSSYLWGWAADRYGCRPVALISLLSSAATTIMFGLSVSYAMACAARLLTGLLNGTLVMMKVLRMRTARRGGSVRRLTHRAPAQCYLGRITTSRNQARAFAMLSVTYGIGSIVAPSTAGLLARPVLQYPNAFAAGSFWDRFAYFLPSVLAAAVALASAGIVYHYMRESVPRSDAAAATASDGDIVPNGSVSGPDADSVSDADKPAPPAVPDGPAHDAPAAGALAARLPAGTDGERAPDRQRATSNRRRLASAMIAARRYLYRRSSAIFRNLFLSYTARPPTLSRRQREFAELSENMTDDDEESVGDDTVAAWHDARPSSSASLADAHDADASLVEMRPLASAHAAAARVEASSTDASETSSEYDLTGSEMDSETDPDDNGAAVAPHIGRNASQQRRLLLLRQPPAATGGSPHKGRRDRTEPPAATPAPSAPPDTAGRARGRIALFPASLYGCTAFIWIMIDETFPLLCRAPVTDAGYGMQPAEIGAAQSIVGVTLLPYNLLIYPRVVKRFGLRRSFRYGMVACIANLIILPSIEPLADVSATALWPPLVLAMLIRACASATTFTSVMIMVNNSVLPQHMGKINGIGQTFAGIARTLGPLLAGYLWSAATQWNMAFRQGIPYMVQVALALAILLLAFRLRPSVEMPLLEVYALRELQRPPQAASDAARAEPSASAA